MVCRTFVALFSRQVIGCLLVMAITLQAGVAVAAQTTPGEVKTPVEKWGTGEEVRVKVNLKDGTALEGHIQSASNDDFTIAGKETGQPVSVRYEDVAKLKRARRFPAIQRSTVPKLRSERPDQRPHRQ